MVGEEEFFFLLELRGVGFGILGMGIFEDFCLWGFWVGICYEDIGRRWVGNWMWIVNYKLVVVSF